MSDNPRDMGTINNSSDNYFVPGGMHPDLAGIPADEIVARFDADGKPLNYTAIELQQESERARGVLQEYRRPSDVYRRGTPGDSMFDDLGQEGYRFQQSLPHEVETAVAGKQYAIGGTREEGERAYIADVIDQGIKSGKLPHVVESIQRVTTRGVVSFTDDQIGAMSLEDYERYFDDDGQPRPGFKRIPTRSMNREGW